MSYLIFFIIFKALYDDLEVAKSAAARNEVWGVMYMSPNFSRAIEERIGDGVHTNDLVVDESIVSIWMDMSSKFSKFIP